MSLDLERTLEKSLLVIHKYSWLIDAYVLDFFVESHWEKLPLSWKNIFDNIEPEQLCEILQGGCVKTVFPLSFLALIKSVEYLSISRKVTAGANIKNIRLNGDIKSGNNELDCNTQTFRTYPHLNNLFLKHVKLKKRHEIYRICELVEKVAHKSECNAVIDFGSGLGHLVRMLGYRHSFKTLGFEAEDNLVTQARKLDKELECLASKQLHEDIMKGLKRPYHLVKKISSQTDFDCLSKEAVHLIGNSFGLVGLHPCGDLGPLLLKYFVRCSQVKFICMVSCCYMKLSCGHNAAGYPLSSFVSKLNFHELSYEGREIACHAQEVYCKKLRQGAYEDLKVHSYRAALERILVKNWPNLKHSGLRSMKHSNGLSFETYCEMATEKLGIKVPLQDIESKQIQLDLEQWKKVVIFYTCRLILAPLIESVILMDRLLYLQENNINCEIKPVFDPLISPRNHVLTALKK